jgi:hypothetical protein
MTRRSEELRGLAEAEAACKPCTMGVGCDEYGLCYAEAHGQPSQCPHYVAPEHKCWSASATSYVRNADPKATHYAVHFQQPPKKTERGKSFGMIFPTLIVASYAEDAEAVAEKVAAILNEHWPLGDDA